MSQEQSTSYSVRLDWSVVDDFPISYANEFMIQQFRDEFIIAVGQISPPGLVQPTREEIEAIGRITPTILARFAITPNNLRIFVENLQGQLRTYDERGAEVSESTEPSGENS